MFLSEHVSGRHESGEETKEGNVAAWKNSSVHLWTLQAGRHDVSAEPYSDTSRLTQHIMQTE